MNTNSRKAATSEVEMYKGVKSKRECDRDVGVIM
jgi:hypothetical protein